MRYVRPSPQTVQWGYFDASLAPAAEVDPGEVFRFRSVTGSPDDAVPPEWVQPEIAEIYASVRERGPGGHLLTGPVAVRGARPGRVLQVDIISVELGAPYGINAVGPLKGIFPDAVHAWDKQIIPIDRERRVATLPPGLRVPTPRKHGGNMDLKELVGGTTLFLPVWADGALFSAGDGHAAQGDGEVCITAIETSLEGEFRLGLRADFELSLPIAVTPTHLIAMGFDATLDRAARVAVGTLMDLLERFGGMGWRDAYGLASIAADLHVTQVVNGEKGVHAMLPRAIAEQLPSRLPFLDGL